MNQRKIVYISDLTHTCQTIALNTVPFAVGGLVAFAKAKLPNSDRFTFRTFKYPEKLMAALCEQLPDIICFSNYVWNSDLGYQIVRRVKAKKPDVVVIFGGPNYSIEPEDQKQFFVEHPLIDFYVYREGEVAFMELLQKLADHHFNIRAVKKIKPRGCHCLLDGELISGIPINRIKNLDDIPSPYLTGVLDEFFDPYLIPVIQTNRGCPFTCTYCVEGQDCYNEINRHSAGTILQELMYIAERKHQNIHDLHIADSNFGMYREDENIAEAIAQVQDKFGWPKYVHVATGKNQKERVLKVAKTMRGALRLAGSVQSLTEQVLKNIKRSNVSEKQLIEVAEKAKDFGSNTYSEIIVALPGETKETHLKTIETIVNTKFNWVRIYTLMMLAGAGISLRTERQQYEMQTRFRILPRCFGIYPFGNEGPVLSAEVEEVCVATKDMPFKDYLDSRLFHLTVELFYNDSVSAELVEFLDLFNIPVFDWLKHIHDHRNQSPAALKTIYNKFLQETRDELWPSKEALWQFARNKAVLQKYIAGEYGNNLIFTHKAQALTGALREVIAVAYDCARSILQAKAPDILDHYRDYLAELQTYSELRKLDLFNTSKTFTATFHYDFLELEKRRFKVRPEDYRRPEGLRAVFFHTEEQRRVIDDGLHLYGRGLVGLARILSKIHVTRAYRTLSYIAP